MKLLRDVEASAEHLDEYIQVSAWVGGQVNGSLLMTYDRCVTAFPNRWAGRNLEGDKEPMNKCFMWLVRSFFMWPLHAGEAPSGK